MSRSSDFCDNPLAETNPKASPLSCLRARRPSRAAAAAQLTCEHRSAAMVQPKQAASAQTAARTSSTAPMSRSQRSAVLQRAMSSPSRIGLKRWSLCCGGYVLTPFENSPSASSPLSQSHPAHTPNLFRSPRGAPNTPTVTCHLLISLSRPRLRSSIQEQTLRQNSALPLNVTSGQRIPPHFPREQRQQMPPLPSRKTPSAPFPSLLSLASDPRSRNLNNLMKKRADPLGILQFPRTCPVSLSQTSRDGTTAALPCSS